MSEIYIMGFFGAAALRCGSLCCSSPAQARYIGTGKIAGYGVKRMLTWNITGLYRGEIVGAVCTPPTHGMHVPLGLSKELDAF